MKEGSFVVRTNERSNVVLSLLHNDQAYHVQTEVFHEGDQTRYRQVKTFDIVKKVHRVQFYKDFFVIK